MNVLNWIKENKILLAILILGTILRFYKLDFQSLWIDEIFSMIQSSPKKSFNEIFVFLKDYDPHPPLYYFSLKTFLFIFGNTTWVARCFSALCGIAGLIAIYVLGKELLNKKAGLIATLLTAINFFHIYYSQEIRMYSLMFLTTTMSFYFLIKFIKSPKISTMLMHCLFATIMIYTQFFSLFALFSQYVILLYFVIKPFQISSKKFLTLSFLSGIGTLILYIPGLIIFLKTSEMNSIWIQLPDSDVYTKLFKELFGYAEIPIFIIILSIIIYFFKLFQRVAIKEGYVNPNREKHVFSFLILFIWIFITLVIPLIASYLKLPMIVSRYFINILPAILLLVASGIYYMKNSAIQFILVASFLIFSMTDVFIVKDYYFKTTKSQFNEVTKFIKDNSAGKTKVVTYWSWLMPYYFEDSSNIKIHANTLDEYILSLRNGTVSKTSFWYLDGHSRPLNLSVENKTYLEANFILKNKIEKFDSWANYYVLNSTNQESEKNKLSLDLFNSATFDGNNFMILFENTTQKSTFINLEKGEYEFVIKGLSLPKVPIDNENAHVIIKVNNKEIANYYVSNQENDPEKIFKFQYSESGKAQFEIIYDNDVVKDNLDRNAVINYIKIKKK